MTTPAVFILYTTKSRKQKWCYYSSGDEEANDDLAFIPDIEKIELRFYENDLTSIEKLKADNSRLQAQLSKAKKVLKDIEWMYQSRGGQAYLMARDGLAELEKE